MANPISDALSSPKSARTGAGSVEARSADELIKLTRFQAAQAAAANASNPAGLQFTKIQGPAQCPSSGIQGDFGDGGGF